MRYIIFLFILLIFLVGCGTSSYTKTKIIDKEPDIIDEDSNCRINGIKTICDSDTIYRSGDVIQYP